MMRSGTLLAFLALTAFACGGTDNATEEVTPEATVSAGGPYLTHDELVNLFKEEIMSGKLASSGIVGRSATVPPESGIEHEGIVWLEVRTVNTVIDTAWVIASSGFPEVDEFALNQVLKSTRTWKIGWGDPPLKMHFTVSVPTDDEGQDDSFPELDTAELGTFSFLAAIPPDSDLMHEETFGRCFMW